MFNNPCVPLAIVIGVLAHNVLLLFSLFKLFKKEKSNEVASLANSTMADPQTVETSDVQPDVICINPKRFDSQNSEGKGEIVGFEFYARPTATAPSVYSDKLWK